MSDQSGVKALRLLVTITYSKRVGRSSRVQTANDILNWITSERRMLWWIYWLPKEQLKYKIFHQIYQNSQATWQNCRSHVRPWGITSTGHTPTRCLAPATFASARRTTLPSVGQGTTRDATRSTIDILERGMYRLIISSLVGLKKTTKLHNKREKVNAKFQRPIFFYALYGCNILS